MQGAPSLSLCAGMTLYGESVEKGWAGLRQSIVELLDYIEGTDLRLLIEPAHRFESNLILTVADRLRMTGECGSERLGICQDTGHAKVNGEDLMGIVAKLKEADVTLHVHIDDNKDDRDGHLIPGESTIDFAPFGRALEKADYKGFVSAELGFQYTHEQNGAVYAFNSLLHAPKAHLNAVLVRIREVLKPAGLFYYGVLGGIETEGVYEEDDYTPKRFFALYRDEQIQEIAAAFFDPLSFRSVPIELPELHIQRMLLRRRKDEA